MQPESSLLERQEKKIKPKIAEVVKALFKPYEKLLSETDERYGLKCLTFQVGSRNLRVNSDTMCYFETYREVLIHKIFRKIRWKHNDDKDPAFSLRDIKAIMKDNNIDQDIISTIVKAITKSKMLNLSFEDCYMLFKLSTKIEGWKLVFHNSYMKKIEKLKSNLLKAKTAIIVINVKRKTKLADLRDYCDSIASKTPDETLIAFSFDVKHKLKNDEMYLLIGY